MSFRRPDLGRLLRPRSIALFGGRSSAEIITQCRRMGFLGAIWPVHPKFDEMAGLPVYRSAADLPGIPDAAFIGVNRETSVEVVRALAELKTGGAVCYASGFSEVGDGGAAFQQRLVEAAGSMPFFGPNCHGFVNYLDGVALWPEQHGGVRLERGVALITQSGNIALNLTMQARGVPVAYLITLGNQAALGLSAAIEAVLDDPRVSAIGLHIEGIDHPGSFHRAAGLARAKGVPIVAVKTGRTEAGARLALSHTASLAGPDAVVEAFLRRAGVARVRSLTVLLESLKLLHVHGPLPGRDIASMSCSGGEAGLMADTGGDWGLRFRPLTELQAGAVAATLPEFASATNPLDYHNFTWGDEPALTATFTAMMAAAYDLTLLVLDFPRADRCVENGFDVTLRSLVAAARQTGGRAAVLSTLQETLPESRALELISLGIAPLAGFDDGLAAVAAAAEAGDLLRAQPMPALLSTKPPALAGRLLTEWEAKRVLAEHGLSVPRGRLAASEPEAVLAAAEIGFPVVLKAVGGGLAHKTEVGAVKLDLRSQAAVRRAAAAMRPLGEALMVEEMIGDGVAELIIGVNRDPTFGLYMVVGSGGVLVDLVADRRIVLLPARRSDFIEAVLSLKAAALLKGYRGRPAGDLEAVADAMMVVQDYAQSRSAELLELDVNPLIVRPQGKGAVAADALIRVTEDPQNG